MSIVVNDIVKKMEKLSPLKYAYDWDNVGLLVGDRKRTVKKILVALDVTDYVVEEAIENNVDMIVSHHPIIFGGVKRITTDNFLGKKLIKLIENKISVYSAHTNFDTVGGLSELLSNRLQLNNQKILDVLNVEKLYKIAVFVPKDNSEEVRNALSEAGAGHIGNYSCCTYSTQGEGTFKPLDGSNPYIGEKGQLEKVDEIKIETIVKEEELNKVVQSMIKAHPYEEVAYDVYPLHQKGEAQGIGRIGTIDDECSLKEYAEEVKKRLDIDSVRVFGDLDKKIKKVAVSQGSGKSNIHNALRAKADVLVTGDIDYHTGIDALQEGLSLIDAGHFGTEYIMIDFVKDYLEKTFEDDDQVSIIKSNNKAPFETI